MSKREVDCYIVSSKQADALHEVEAICDPELSCQTRRRFKYLLSVIWMELSEQRKLLKLNTRRLAAETEVEALKTKLARIKEIMDNVSEDEWFEGCCEITKLSRGSK